MKNEIEVHEYILPAHFASYLINGDASGYTDEELTQVQQWEKGKGYCVGTTDDTPEFRHGHDLNRNQGADCLAFIFHLQNSGK